MLISILVFLAVASLSFFMHELGEAWLIKKYRNIALVVRGYHIHHSVYGVLAIAVAVILGGKALLVGAGFGLGNLWHHKLTHNRQNESGMVLVTKHQALPEDRAELEP